MNDNESSMMFPLTLHSKKTYFVGVFIPSSCLEFCIHEIFINGYYGVPSVLCQNMTS